MAKVKIPNTVKKLLRKRLALLERLAEEGLDVVDLRVAPDAEVIDAAWAHYGRATTIGRKSMQGLHYHYAELLKLSGTTTLPPLTKTQRHEVARLLRAPKTLAEAKRFYASYQWRRVRYEVLKRDERRCQLCGATAASGAVLHVDHIRPLRYNCALRLDVDNLQTLCSVCNHGKGNWDSTDWRAESPKRSVPRLHVVK